MQIGVLAIQGDFDAHVKKCEALDVVCRLVRKPDDLTNIDGLIIPGGESTTLLKFLQRDHFLEAIKNFHEQGGAIFGTCAGAILLAANVEPEQPSLKLLPITVTRNAYGRQLFSAIKQGTFLTDQSSCECVFIRAPKFTEYSENVTPLVQCDDHIVALRANRCIASTYHPELSNDTRLHKLFLAMCQIKEEL